MTGTAGSTSREQFDQFRMFALKCTGVLLAILVVVWFAFDDLPETNPELAFGCYLSKSGSVIRVAAEGVRLEGRNDDFTIPFELEFAKGYQIVLEGSVEFVVDDDAPYWTETDRGWSNLLRFVDEASLSPRSVRDPERLDTIQAVTTSSTYVLFDRMPVTDC